jgi:Flp pilus assembly pilin Flp
MSALRTIKTWLSELRKNDSGQDLIEYALLAAAVVIVVAGFLPTQLMPSVSTIFSKITSSLAIS